MDAVPTVRGGLRAFGAIVALLLRGVLRGRQRTESRRVRRPMSDAGGVVSWQDEAACRGTGELFFSTRSADRREAMAICRECPVLDPCRAQALAAEQMGVVQGGIDLTTVKSEEESVRRVSGRPMAPPTKATQCPACMKWWDQVLAQGRRSLYCTDPCRAEASARQARLRRKAS